MEEIRLAPEFRQHLVETYDVDPGMLDRIVEDIWDHCAQSPEDYVQLRHTQLQKQGYLNDEIYRVLSSELSRGRFASPPYSLRQIRRMIYG